MLALSINWVRMEYQFGDNLTTLWFGLMFFALFNLRSTRSKNESVFCFLGRNAC